MQARGQTSDGGESSWTSYLCICSLVWWRPTAVVNKVEERISEHRQTQANGGSGWLWTYESWAVVTESGLHVGGLLEIMDETETKFGTDDTGPHEVGCDLISADKTLPEKIDR